MTNTDAERVSGIVAELREFALDSADEKPDWHPPICLEAADIIEAQSKALAEAIPYVETLHSLLAGKPQRQQVMAVIRRMQAATPTPENPNG